MESDGINLVLLISLIAIFSFAAQQANGKVCNVNDYGAVADGSTDNSQAFVKAWDDACRTTSSAQVVVPDGVYMVKSAVFEGPCEGAINFLLHGTIKAFPGASRSQTFLISFQYVDKLQLYGDGVVDGQGATAWASKNGHSSLQLPFSIGFYFVTNSLVTGIKSLHSKGTHFNLFACNTLKIDGVVVEAPADSPNTDGIRISSSTTVLVTNTRIGTGDDCLSILSGNHGINITNTICGPGHGVSVGSLGKYLNEKDVSDLTVSDCTLSGTNNGVRLKTLAPSASQITVSSLRFENIFMDHVHNPILIDQNYCPSNDCPSAASSVQIRDVSFINIYGISETEDAVQLSCSPTHPCSQITLQNIRLHYAGPILSTSSCQNADGVAIGLQIPSPCVT